MQTELAPEFQGTPEGRESEAILRKCVHCGFCLPTCPTYLLEGNETNSPRGRIYLMKLGNAGEVPMDAEFVGNFDACLGCMACVTACPSGVKYDQLIEAGSMAEAKARGYNTKVMRKVIALRKRDKDDIAEEEAILEMYKAALGMV